MLTEDLLQLAKANKDKSMDQIRKLYDYIEKCNNDEVKKEIIKLLQESNFDFNIVDIFLLKTGTIQEKKELAYQATYFNHEGIDKEAFLNKLINDPDMRTIDKTQLLLILKDEDKYETAMYLYVNDYFGLIDYKQSGFQLFKKAIEIYNKIKQVYTEKEEELNIDAFFNNVPLDLVEYTFDQAIKKYDFLNSEDVNAIDNFLCNKKIRKCRVEEDLKEMVNIYIDLGLNNSVFEIYDCNALLKERWTSQKQVIDLYKKSNFHKDFASVISHTESCLTVLNFPYYFKLIEEVVGSNFNEDTVEILRDSIQYHDWVMRGSVMQWYDNTLQLMRESYQIEFREQLDKINDVNQFIEYLSRIEEKDGNCDLKPNTMVKKFNEVKPKSED